MSAPTIRDWGRWEIAASARTLDKQSQHGNHNVTTLEELVIQDSILLHPDLVVRQSKEEADPNQKWCEDLGRVPRCRLRSNGSVEGYQWSVEF